MNEVFGLAPWDQERLSVDEFLRRVAYIDRMNEKAKEAERKK